MTDPEPSRVFLVGCSRSGTTALQYQLARNPLIFSLPETDYFGRLLGNPLWRAVARGGWVRARSARRALAKLEEITGVTAPRSVDGAFVSTAACIDIFTETLDGLARQSGKQVWLEKTPKHYRYVREIEQFVPDARFIHMVRDGRAVVASIRDRADQYPDEFGHQRHPAYAVRLWNRAVRAALKRRLAGRDLTVFYEDFVDNPADTVARVYEVLELHHHDSVTQDESDDSRAVVTEQEPWKSRAASGVYNAGSKFQQVFSPAEQAYVQRRLDWGSYNRLKQLG